MTDYSAAAGIWDIDASHTNVGFSARHAMVAKTRGRFADVSGTITIDAEAPEKSTTTVTIKTDSVDTRNEQRDGHLKSADFFDVEKNPEITFVSTAISHRGDDEFVLTGDLTISGVTKSVDVDVEYLGVNADPFGNTRIGFEGEAEVSRKDFGLTWNAAIEGGGVLVSDKIKIELDVEAVKQA